MVEQLTKLISCIAYTRRSCRKLGFVDIASKLTPVLGDLRAEMVRLSAIAPVTVEAGVQVETEVISRVQFESILLDIEGRYTAALEQLTTRMQEQMDTIRSLQEQLTQQGSSSSGCLFTAEAPMDEVMFGGHGSNGSGADEDAAPSQFTTPALDLQRLREEHIQQRLNSKRQRREARLARLKPGEQMGT